MTRTHWPLQLLPGSLPLPSRPHRLLACTHRTVWKTHSSETSTGFSDTYNGMLILFDLFVFTFLDFSNYTYGPWCTSPGLQWPLKMQRWELLYYSLKNIHFRQGASWQLLTAVLIQWGHWHSWSKPAPFPPPAHQPQKRCQNHQTALRRHSNHYSHGWAKEGYPYLLPLPLRMVLVLICWSMTRLH